jgi:hypothetical protein
MEGRVLQMNNVKKKVAPVYTYVVLLTNGETFEVEAESYFDIADDEGNPIRLQFVKDKNTVLKLDATAVETVISKDSANWESILAAIRKRKPVRKKAKVSK